MSIELSHGSIPEGVSANTLPSFASPTGKDCVRIGTDLYLNDDAMEELTRVWICGGRLSLTKALILPSARAFEIEDRCVLFFEREMLVVAQDVATLIVYWLINVNPKYYERVEPRLRLIADLAQAHPMTPDGAQLLASIRSIRPTKNGWLFPAIKPTLSS